MDTLSEILETVRLRCFVGGRSELSAPWGIRLGQRLAEVPEHLRQPDLDLPAGRTPPSGPPGGGFFAVLRGSCWLELEGTKPAVSLAGGDLVVISHEGGVRIRDSLRSPTVPIWVAHPPEKLRRNLPLVYGGGGAVTHLVFGGFHFENRGQNRLLSALPPLIHVKAGEGPSYPWLEDTLRFIAHETATRGPGGQCVINHLAHILFVQAVRAYVAGLPADNRNWLGALMDPDIGPALGQIHARPEEPWTVASLAETATMSRTAFAARFAAAVGEPPLHYLTQYRMQKATSLLTEGRLTIKEISRRVGYESEAAFCNAFKRCMGVSPGNYRKAGGVP